MRGDGRLWRTRYACCFFVGIAVLYTEQASALLAKLRLFLGETEVNLKLVLVLKPEVSMGASKVAYHTHQRSMSSRQSKSARFPFLEVGGTTRSI